MYATTSSLNKSLFTPMNNSPHSFGSFNKSLFTPNNSPHSSGLYRSASSATSMPPSSEDLGSSMKRRRRLQPVLAPSSVAESQAQASRRTAKYSGRSVLGELMQLPLAQQVRKPSSTNGGAAAIRSKSCLCSPTSHPGSFRCRLHRGSDEEWPLPTTPPRSTAAPATSPLTSPTEITLSKPATLPSSNYAPSTINKTNHLLRWNSIHENGRDHRNYAYLPSPSTSLSST